MRLRRELEAVRATLRRRRRPRKSRRVLEAENRELRNRIDQSGSGPWRREDPDFPGTRW